jgi:[histone H3]-lysine36 N-trimethyltransferase
MADDTRDTKPKPGVVDAALSEMKLEEGGSHPEADDTIARNGTYDAPTPEDIKRSRSSTPMARKSSSQSPFKKQSASQTPKSEDDEEEIIGGDIMVTVEPGKGPKLSRKSSQKVVARPPQLFDQVEDSTEEAFTVFQAIKDCIYGSKYMGYSEHDALDCDCSEQWGEYLWFAGSTNADECSSRRQESCVRRGFRLYQPCN